MTIIEDPAALRELYPAPKSRSLAKVVRHLDVHCTRFIELSPFCVIASLSHEQTPDLSPRGGEPGFVRVLNQQTLLLPDRPGNNRLDSLSNLAARPAVAVLFFVPGVDETLRVFGTAEILPSTAFEHPAAAGSRPPLTGLRIAVERAFFQCGKALMRSRLWQEEAQIDRASFPTLGQLLKDQTGDPAPIETQEEMLQRYAGEL